MSTVTNISTILGAWRTVARHGRPEVLAAIHEALDEGTHFGASHPRELAWARVIQRLVPTADRNLIYILRY
ncbi:MAG: hypothetical protein CM1200mP41_02260 [Gammaproteobacteria bacterium]|nr:MAG: hypothetical protein CM1200mP41_02260 [Gammaproteobacteria bacterium]